MVSRSLLNHILANDRLTQGLHDPEPHPAEWLVADTERWSDHGLTGDRLHNAVANLCRRAADRRLCLPWRHQEAPGDAYQLAATSAICRCRSSRSTPATSWPASWPGRRLFCRQRTDLAPRDEIPHAEREEYTAPFRK